MKVCITCKIEKPLCEFNKRANQKDGFDTVCRLCANKRTKEWKNREDVKKKLKDYENKEYVRKRRRESNWKKQGITLTMTEYDKMYDERNGLCDICKQYFQHTLKLGKVSTKLLPDHCHKTGKIRGLLCDSCNHLEGNSKQSLDIILALFNYTLKNLF